LARKQIKKCWFDGILQLRKGDIIQIIRAYEESYQDYTLRVTLMDVVTTGARYHSPFDTNRLPEPILGRVIRSEVTVENRTTRFEIVEGHFEDHVFVTIGEFEKGQAALKEIFTCRIDVYVKVWDPYINIDTIKLVSNAARSITILILTQNITNKDKVIEEANKLPNRVIIRKPSNLHDRIILTMGEGWTVGHSLKDFGTKPSLLTKLASSLEAERAFDENWIQTEIVFEKD
jgi:hypothetical protein